MAHCDGLPLVCRRILMVGLYAVYTKTIAIYIILYYYILLYIIIIIILLLLIIIIIYNIYITIIYNYVYTYYIHT